MRTLSRFHERKLRERGVRELTAGEALRPKFRFRNPVIPGVTDVYTQKLRDFYSVAAATAVSAQILYTIQIGGAYTPTGGTQFNKTRFHTNLTQAGQLAAPRRFLVKGLTAFVNGNIAPSDLNQMLFNTLVALWIDEKRYFECLLGQIPGGGGGFGAVSAFQTTAANASYSVLGNGYPSANAIFAFEGDGLWIELLQNFSVVLDPTLVQAGAFTTAAAGGTTFGQGVNIEFALEGLLAGPVM